MIIPARNEERHLGEQLDALQDQEWDGEWEVIVVDNGSTDGTAALVLDRARGWPRLRLISAPERGDQSYAANQGVAATSARAWVFCDGDDIVQPGWVAAFGEALSEAGVVTGPLELDRLNPRRLANSRGRSVEAAVGSFAGLFPVVRGNNYGTTRAVWEHVGPLAEQSFPVADVEFSLRVHRAGIDVVGVARARVHYRYRSSLEGLWRQGFAYGRGRTRIVRLLVEANEPRPARFAGWRSWAWLVANCWRVVRPAGRQQLVWVAANRWGQLVGSIENRVLYL